MLTISPLDIRYAQEARYYTLFAAGFVFVTISLFRLWKGQRITGVYIVGFVWLSLTNIFAVAVWITHAFTLAVMAAATRSHMGDRDAFFRLDRATTKRVAVVVFLFALLLGMLYGPGLWSRLQEPSAAISTIHRSPMKVGAGDSSASMTISTWFWDVYYRTFKWFAVPSGLADNRSMTLLGIPPGYQWPLRICGLLLAIGLISTWKRFKERPWILAFQLLFLISLLALATERFGPSIGVLAFGVRRLLFLLPIFWLLVALGCEAVGKMVTKWTKRPFTSFLFSWSIALLLGGAISLSILPGYYRWRKDDWRSAASYLQSHVQPTQPILCCTSWQTDPTFEWTPLTFYLRSDPLRKQLMYVKGQNLDDLIDHPVRWAVSYGEPPDPQMGYIVTQSAFIGPYWIWIEQLELTTQSSAD